MRYISGQTDVGNKEIDLRKKNLLPLQNILSSRQIAADMEEKLANQGEVLHGRISHIYLSSSNKWKLCHKVINSLSHIISEQDQKSTFDFREIVNKLRVEARSSWQTKRFISQFSIKLYI